MVRSRIFWVKPVLTIPPAFVDINLKTTTVTRRVCAAVLFASQGIRQGVVAYTPVIRKQSDVLRTPMVLLL